MSGIDGYEFRGTVLGEGPNGQVRQLHITQESRLFHPKWPETLALKVYTLSSTAPAPCPVRLRHCNVVPVLQPSPKGTVLMKHCITNLRDFMDRGHKEGTIQYEHIRQIGLHCLVGLIYLHEGGNSRSDPIIHGNLKPENVLFGPVNAVNEYDEIEGHAKLSDYGVTPQKNCLYQAPEVKRGGKSTTHSDMYSLGVILLELAVGQENLGSVLSSKRAQERALKMVQHPDLADCLRELLNTNPEKRPPPRDLVKHPFFVPQRNMDEADPNPLIDACKLIGLIFGVTAAFSVLVILALISSGHIDLDLTDIDLDNIF